MAITTINPVITDVGRAAAINAQGTGLQLAITHVSLGTGKYTPNVTQTAMQARVETVAIAGGVAPGDGSLRITALFPATASSYNASEIGFWAGDPAASGKLFAVWSSPTDTVVSRSNIDYIAAFGLKLTTIPAASVTVTVDVSAAQSIALMTAHEGAGDPHTVYGLKSGIVTQQYSSNTVTGGSGAAYTLSITPAMTTTTLKAMAKVKCILSATSTTTTPTLSVSGLTAKAIKVYNVDGTLTDPPVGLLTLGAIAEFTYDGTYWVYMNPPAILDATKSANAVVSRKITNPNTGIGADARQVASNGVTDVGIIMRGTGHPDAGQGILYVSGVNPLVFSLNGLERERIEPATGAHGFGITSPTAPIDVKSRFTGAGQNNGGIRVERFNSTVAGHIENISGLGLFDGSRYEISGSRVPDGTASSGILFGSGFTTIYCNTGLTAGAAFAPTPAVTINPSTVTLAANIALCGTDSVGTDIPSGNFLIRTGRPTGAGAGGYFAIQTAQAGASGASLGALASRWFVDQYGRCGVGALPNTNWFQGSRVIDFGAGRGAIGIGAGGGNEQVFFVSNASTPTSDTGLSVWTYTNAGSASKIEMRGGLRLSVAATGVAGADIAWVDAIYLTAGDARFTVPPVPASNGGATNGTAALRWGTTFTQALDATGNILTSGSSAAIGYTTGAGAAVTQATSKATGVTLNNPTGKITLSAASLAANTAVSFVLTNSLIGANDIPRLVIASGGTVGAYTLSVDAVAAGSCTITLRNMTAGALAEAVVLNFALIKGTNA